jgi:hypothetical protein
LQHCNQEVQVGRGTHRPRRTFAGQWTTTRSAPPGEEARPSGPVLHPASSVQAPRTFLALGCQPCQSQRNQASNLLLHLRCPPCHLPKLSPLPQHLCRTLKLKGAVQPALLVPRPQSRATPLPTPLSSSGAFLPVPVLLSQSDQWKPQVVLSQQMGAGQEGQRTTLACPHGIGNRQACIPALRKRPHLH